MRPKKFYSNLSIKYKILVLIYGVIFLISVSFGIYSYSLSEKQVLQNVDAAHSEVIKQISSNIEFLQKDVYELSTSISISTNIQSMYIDQNKNYTNLSKNYLQNISSLNFILDYIVSKEYISGVIMYNKYGQPLYFEFTDGSSGIPIINKKSDYRVYNKVVSKKGQPLWFTLNNKSAFLVHNNVTPKVCMGRLVKNVNTSEAIGSMFIFIREDYIKSIYKNSIKANNYSIFITDDNNDIISSSGKLPAAKDIKTIEELSKAKNYSGNYLTHKISGEDMLITSSHINDTNWKIYYLTPTNTMTKQINSIKLFTLMIILFAMLLSFPLVVFITSHFTNPLKKILQSMKRFEKGNFDERVSFKTNDEIGMLGDGYNKMIRNIKELIDQTYILQIKEREAELSALQAQINPHFLYNTLNSIFWKAHKNNQYEISEMVQLLSTMFRLTLNQGKDWISIEKEAELISCYLKLQKMRFNERLTFNINIEKELLSLYIPRFILQPFVENAVVHGIDDKVDGIEVTISGKLITRNMMLFKVQDNGLGMSKQTIDKLNLLNHEAIEYNENEGSGYAIKNVNEKLKLIFHDNFRIKFESEIGQGTTVYIKLPVTNNITIGGK